MEMTLTNGDVRIEWTNLNEGYGGDYDPSDPEDVNLLRFDVYQRAGGEWVMVDDASYCTLTPADTPEPVLRALLEKLIDEVKPALDSEASIRKLCERLSWIAPTREWLGREPTEIVAAEQS